MLILVKDYLKSDNYCRLNMKSSPYVSTWLFQVVVVFAKIVYPLVVKPCLQEGDQIRPLEVLLPRSNPLSLLFPDCCANVTN